MGVATITSSSTITLNPPRCLCAARLFSSRLSFSPSCSPAVCVQVSCAWADSASHHRSLHGHRRNFSLRFASALLLLQWLGCGEVARAGDTDMLKRIEAFVDPMEVTKTGKRLPRSYVQSARELVRTLREALKDDVQQELKSRAVSESAKEAIRVYLSSLRSSKELPAEDSFQALTKALRVLGQFYLTAGPMASLPQDVKATILQNLEKADAAL